MKIRKQNTKRQPTSRRAGVATLDYILVLVIILPLAAFIVPTGQKIIRLVYEMFAVFVTWPFM